MSLPEPAIAELSVSIRSLGKEDDRLLDRIDAVLSSAAARTLVGTTAIGEAEIERCASAGFDFLVVGYDAHYPIDGSRRARDADGSVGFR